MNKALVRHWERIDRDMMIQLAMVITLSIGLGSVWVVFALLSLAAGA